MSNFFNEFSKTSKSDWETKLIADLKGESIDILNINNPIEDIKLDCYKHAEDLTEASFCNSPIERGGKKVNNDWKNGALVSVSDNKTANREALKALNLGADLIVFKESDKKIDWKIVLKEVKLEFIQTKFNLLSLEALDSLLLFINGQKLDVEFQIDFLNPETSISIKEASERLSTYKYSFASVNGFDVQQSGANTWQEIAFCLSTGNEYLLSLVNCGLSVDEANASISFNIGVGPNYFFEIAKIRALKQLWAKVIQAYNPKNIDSKKCKINAVIGHSNKSIVDPHTNLLRQSTEAMSAAASGVNSIVVLPHDMYSSTGATDLAKRMAINISTILKEESYFDKVVDPVGGSYSIEAITEEIAKKAWEKFQSLDKNGGIFIPTVLDTFTQAVEAKRKQRIELFNNKQTVGIGINKYDNPKPSHVQWTPIKSYLNFKPLVLEKEYKTFSA